MQLIVPYKTPTGAGSGDMLKANNLGDVVSVASARANLDVISRGECLGRDISQGAGGVLFDGRTSSSCRLYSALGAAGSIGSGEFSLWLRLRMPQAGSSGSPKLAWVGSDNNWIDAAGTFAVYYGTGASLYARLYTDGSNYIVRTLTNLRSSYEGQVVDLVFVRSAAGLTLYVNGSEWTAYSDATTGSGAWTSALTSTYLGLGPAASTAATQAYYRCVMFNVALTASEVSEVVTIGIPYRFKWASNATPTSSGIPYASDFSAGINGWSALGIGTVTGNIDGIGGQDDNLRYLDSGANGGHQAAKLFLAPGKSYKFSGKVYIPSANTTLVEVRPYLNNCQITDPITTKDAWTSWSGTATSDGTALQLLGQNSAHASTFTGTSGDAFYVREVTVLPRGAIVDLDLLVGAGVQIPDRSSNGLHAANAYGISGWEHKVQRKNGEFLVIRTLAHSDISATGETTPLLSLLANCGVLDVEFDRETAFDAGTTVDIGITGNNTKYVNGANAAATGKLLADSGSKGSESATAPNTVYIKKNQATTQGQTTVRLRCVIRG